MSALEKKTFTSNYDLTWRHDRYWLYNFVATATQTRWSVNSCYEGTNVVEFDLGDTGTMFAIAVKRGKHISDYSAM
jgi:hypothetical protein